MRRLILAMLATACAVVPALAQSLKPDEVYSSIVVEPESQPHPVLGSDNRIHLAYELVVTNPSRLFMTLDPAMQLVISAPGEQASSDSTRK